MSANAPAIGSNSLPDLAARIDAEHHAVGLAMKRGLKHALTAGNLLLEAKAVLGHGKWLPWLQANCKVPERTAQLYMRLARHKSELAAISATVADLTIRGAIEALVPEQQLEIWPLPRSLPDLPALPPRILTRCADCGLGTIIACENYWVRDFVWGRAWADRLKPWHKAPGQQVLCIACLEHRIGRQLIRDDFVSASDVKSDRLAARLNSPTHALDDWRTASRQRDIT